ncbi:hypothetical protein GGTG_12927 [Gaeumannomyces tritici R3-111a-1]|uniref:Uncharacterized protein n=1 Tax=Gaeumannomyces tritici (strain R3-111a-1) TaxID=644352 RepID=J3PHE8_GAET3|nr:hypothetical protein GGTG_12927 [Gaeumannomyces tritici R3-111a-1]EJT69308.1 hypothetical protein GGTG_12927 [Gaeumannomyces tritici R3-111a-1]
MAHIDSQKLLGPRRSRNLILRAYWLARSRSGQCPSHGLAPLCTPAPPDHRDPTLTIGPDLRGGQSSRMYPVPRSGCPFPGAACPPPRLPQLAARHRQ